jgi:hypothetical protein
MFNNALYTARVKIHYSYYAVSFLLFTSFASYFCEHVPQLHEANEAFETSEIENRLLKKCSQELKKNVRSVSGYTIQETVSRAY